MTVSSGLLESGHSIYSDNVGRYFAISKDQVDKMHNLQVSTGKSYSTFDDSVTVEALELVVTPQNNLELLNNDPIKIRLNSITPVAVKLM